MILKQERESKERKARVEQKRKDEEAAAASAVTAEEGDIEEAPIEEEAEPKAEVESDGATDETPTVPTWASGQMLCACKTASE